MSKIKMNCGYCGRKCNMETDFCIPQDSVYICKKCYEWQDKVSKLEAKFAEKEIECQELLNSIKIKDLSNINFIQVNEDIVRFSKGGVLYEYNKKENTICKIIDTAHQEKIEFAVGQLEKLKNYIIGNETYTFGDYPIVYVEDITEEIDNQINVLRNNKDGIH